MAGVGLLWRSGGRRSWRLALACAATLAPVAAHGQALPPDPPSQAPPAAVVAAVRAAEVAQGPADAPLSPGEARAIHDIVRGARVIGFGEAGHAAREPLEYRNRLIRHLVEHEGLTAVALEGGLANTRRAGDWVLGGPGDPEALVRDNYSWMFGELVANTELVRWLRAWNADPVHRKVRLFGVDPSVRLVLQTAPELDAQLPLGDLQAYLSQTLPDAAPLVARLKAFDGRLVSSTVRTMSAEERARLQAALDAADAQFATRRAAMVAASSPDAYAWAARQSHDLRLTPMLLADWTVALDLPKLMRLVRLRDRMMADNVLWELAREGPGGRMLVFAANGHVVATPLLPAILRGASEVAPVMGEHLHEALGARYRVLVSASAFGRNGDDGRIGSVDRAFAAAGERRAVLDLARLPAAQDWWSRGQTLAQGETRMDEAIPRRAMDGIVYFDALTPAPAFPKPDPAAKP